MECARHRAETAAECANLKRLLDDKDSHVRRWLMRQFVSLRVVCPLQICEGSPQI